MTTFIKLSFVAFSLALVTSCGKKEPERAQVEPVRPKDMATVEAEKILAELTISLQRLRLKPEPNAQWSEEEFKTYADQLDANERNLNKLITLRGKENVRIQGESSVEESRRMIRLKRAALQDARNKRAERAMAESMETQIVALNQQLIADTNFLDIEGFPSSSWPDEKLTRYLDAVNRVEKTLLELDAITGESLVSIVRKNTNQERKGLALAAQKK